MPLLRFEPDIDPDVLRVHRSARSTVLGGALLLVLAVVALGSATAGFASGPGAARFYAHSSAVFGVIFLLSGVYLVSSRSGLVLDRRKREAARWSTEFGRTRTGPPRSFAVRGRIELVRYYLFNRSSVAGEAYRYRLQIVSGGAEGEGDASADAGSDTGAGEDRVETEIGRKLDEAEAREHASSLSDFLGLPVVERRGRAVGVMSSG